MSKQRFGIISNKIMANVNLSLEAKALYALLACYCNTERSCFPSTGTLGRLALRSRPTIFRLLSELEEEGIISKIRQGRRRIILLHDGQDFESKTLCRHTSEGQPVK